MSQQIVEQINTLKKQHHAVILAHYYQPPEIQDIADYTGDSLALSMQAACTDADVIVFCGVRFMAETAAILSPDKAVLLPDPAAGCPMADMITADQLRQLKAEHPGALTVCYVNSTAEVKAESDYCCTSSNAVDLVASLPADREVLFVPDQNLGSHVRRQTGREIVLWPGYCRSHVLIRPEDIEQARTEHPTAVVLAHPECSDAVKDLADALLSTGQMLSFVKQHPADTFIIATELGIMHPLRQARANATYIPASQRAFCQNMKKISLEKLLWALEDQKTRVEVPAAIAAQARQALDRMIGVLPKR